MVVLTLCAVLSRQPMYKASLLSLISKEDDEESYSRFIPLLLFLVQKKETVISAKLCVMVSDNIYGIVWGTHPFIVLFFRQFFKH